MKTLRIVARIILGSVFIFSSFVKGVDPQGFAIKLSEYFESFGLPPMETISLIFGVLVCVGELIIGVCLFIGLRMKITSWAALLFMSFFTVLTFYSALANPVTDCGCFGDAIKLTNWQTFYKNVVFIAFAIFIFIQHKRYQPMFGPTYEWVIVAAYTLAGILIFVFNINHLPVIDFRPYHVGADIKAGMVIPEGAPVSVYETTFLYKKNGEVKEFTDKNYPWNDSTWVWVETKQKLVKQGYEAPIHDFSVTDENGMDLTDSVLNYKGYTFLLISTDLRTADKDGILKASQIAEEAKKNGHSFYCLTASPLDFAASYKKAYNLKFSFYTTDKTTLKTIIRSNPGLVLLKEGVVIGQWHYNDFPEAGFVKVNMLAQQMDNMRKQDNHKLVFLFISVFVISIAGLSLLTRVSKAS